MIEDVDGAKFPEDHDEALNVAKNLTGLNKPEFNSFLKALSKGYLTIVGFGSFDYFSVVFEISCDILSLTFNLDTGLMEKRIAFRFPMKDLELSDEESCYDLTDGQPRRKYQWIGHRTK